MTTTTTPILALDLGKFKSVACSYQPDSQQATFQTVYSNPEQLRQLCQQHPGVTVVFEACALAGWVHDLVVELGLPCRVAHTGGEAWKFKNLKRKTDRDDALKLAKLATLGELTTVHVPEKPTREWRALIGHRQALVGRRVSVQNQLRSVLVSQGLPQPRGAAAWTQAGLAALDELARPLAQCAPTELWRGVLFLALAELRQLWELISQIEARLDAVGRSDERVQLLSTIPGVGPRTAEVVASALDDAGRFHTAGQVSAYAGLVPKQYDSGETCRSGKITRRGPRLLRKLLVECAWVMLRYNHWAREVYARLTHGAKTRRKIAIVALARKLLVRCWAMLRDGTVWREDPDPAPAASSA
jgi:transposase